MIQINPRTKRCIITNLKSGDFAEEVSQILRAASKGKGEGPMFLTAYQILNRLPSEKAQRLIEERTLGGRGSGVQHSAVTVISKAAEQLEGVEISYMDTRGVSFEVHGQSVTPGYEVCALYRIPGRT